MLTVAFAVVLIAAIFYLAMDGKKMRDNLKAQKSANNSAILAMSGRLKDAGHEAEKDRKQLSELARLCGQEHRNLHNLAIGASEGIDGLKHAMAHHIDNVTEKVINMERSLQKVREAANLAVLRMADEDAKKASKKSKKTSKRKKKSN